MQSLENIASHLYQKYVYIYIIFINFKLPFVIPPEEAKYTRKELGSYLFSSLLVW